MAKARPILFSAPMVRALLDGTKTQTRRIIKPQPEWDEEVKSTHTVSNLIFPIGGLGQQCGMPLLKFPYGKPGDLLLVRETWGISSGPGAMCCKDRKPNAPFKGGFSPVYHRADSEGLAWGMYGPPRWKPSIHMPRSASRLTLEITDVRVQRLQEISEANARAEGCQPAIAGQDAVGPIRTYRTGFVRLWNSIHEGGWLQDPWVWALTFKVHHCNVDDLMRERAA